MELAYRLGSGRLSELFGEFTVSLDRFVRTVGWNRAAARQRSAWDERSREIQAAFHAGTRAWIDAMPARPVEYEVIDLQPWLPESPDAPEIAAPQVFLAWSLSGNWDTELLRAEVADQLGWDAVLDLFPDLPSEPGPVLAGRDAGPGGRRTALDLLREAPDLPRGQGSNNWVVAGSRSVTGKPLLANDPHLNVAMPSVWFEIHLTAPGIDVSGVALPFAPGVIIGHNARIAWGFTNVGGDTQDLYLERLSDDGTAARYESAWEPLTTYREDISVRGRGEPEVVVARETRHGPILDAYLVGVPDPTVVEGGIRDTYALRFAGLERGIQPSVVDALNRAADFESFRRAVRDWDSPGQNMVYADVDGAIGYQSTGLHPIRRRGDGTVPVPGWTSEFDWDGWVPFGELPWSLDPEQGYLATANNKPHDEAYPFLLGRDFLPPFRARRIVQLLTARDTHDIDSFAAIHTDTASLPAAEIVPLLLETEPETERQKRAMALLAGWDHDLSADSAAAAIYQVWSGRIAEAVLKPRLGDRLFEHYYARREWTNAFQYQVLPNLLRYPTAAWFGGDGAAARDLVLRDALDAALDELAERMGDDPAGWSWGRIHRVKFASQLAFVPGLAAVFTGGECPVGGDEQTVMQSMFEPGGGTYDAAIVPSWRQIVDLSDFDRSVGTHTVGQSGNPASPHYRDLFALWSSGRYHPLPFSRAAVEEAAESTLTLRPS
jgi:penicillin amidase